MSGYDSCEDVWEALDLISDTSKVVYSHQITQELDQGSLVVVNGRINPDCLRFAVDFTCGDRSIVDGTIAFHFNPRMQEGYVVRNCLIKGAWGDEETTSTTPLVLLTKEAFQLDIFITREQFMVSINGRHFCSFRHRVAIERITSIDFIGHIQIDDVTLKFRDVYPYVRDALVYDVPYDQNYEDGVDLDLPMPFFGTFKTELRVGWQVEIFGKVKLLPHSFYVNLQSGLNMFPHPVIPIHLNPRFSASCGANAFVRNCWADGKWMSEERVHGFPFNPGYAFTMIIRVEDECFAVWVNNMLIAEYAYKVLRKTKIDSIYIQGDIHLHHVSVRTSKLSPQYDFRDDSLMSF